MAYNSSLVGWLVLCLFACLLALFYFLFCFVCFGGGDGGV